MNFLEYAPPDDFDFQARLDILTHTDYVKEVTPKKYFFCLQLWQVSRPPKFQNQLLTKISASEVPTILQKFVSKEADPEIAINETVLVT